MIKEENFIKNKRLALMNNNDASKNERYHPFVYENNHVFVKP